uniref:Uncharacterized protein n=1 Tax=viral metagenome TaxID=1070528 RepID=A0A6M3JKA7_9ZZZZ
MNRPETKGFRSKETHVVDYYEYFRAMSRYADTLESQLKDEKESVNELSRHCQRLEVQLEEAEDKFKKISYLCDKCENKPTCTCPCFSVIAQEALKGLGKDG